MSRSIKLTMYHIRRHYKKILFFSAIVLALSILIAFLNLWNARSMRMTLTGSGMEFRDAYHGVSIYTNPFAVTNGSVFSVAVWLIALFIIKREHKFLIAQSVSRIEIIVTTVCFSAVLSLMMTLIMWLASILGILSIWIGGFNISGGWTAAALLTGNNPKLAVTLFESFSGMFASAGIYTLIGYLFVRWWKIILIIAGAGIAALILFVTQIQVSQYLQQIAENAIEFIRWFVDTFIPYLIDFYNDDHAFFRIGSNMLAGLATFAVSYPVMRRMPVVK